MVRRSVRQIAAAGQAAGQVVDLTDAVVNQHAVASVDGFDVVEEGREPTKDYVTNKAKHNRRRTRSVEPLVPSGIYMHRQFVVEKVAHVSVRAVCGVLCSYTSVEKITTLTTQNCHL
jgi:hypothetical protein